MGFCSRAVVKDKRDMTGGLENEQDFGGGAGGRTRLKALLVERTAERQGDMEWNTE